MSIAAFIAEKMSAYIAGGMSADQAAHFTRGELLAIYKGSHYSRDSAGSLQPTQPPESLDIETAAVKCDEAIRAFLSGSNGAGHTRQEAIEPAPYVTPKEQNPGMTYGALKAAEPEKDAQRELNGFDKMLEYARKPA